MHHHRGGGSVWDAVDQNTDTVYVANVNDSTVSVINGATCNATHTSGCATTPPTVQVGAGAFNVAVDNSLHTVFAVNQGDDTLSAINTRTCQGPDRRLLEDATERRGGIEPQPRVHRESQTP